MAYIPTDVLIDILHCLDRNSIEKFQLISHKWDSAIKTHTNILPLRLINGSLINQGEKLVFVQENYLNSPVNSSKCPKNLPFKNCILKNIRLHKPFDETDSIVGKCGEDFDMKRLVKNLENFAHDKDGRIQVKRFEYSTLDEEKDAILLENLNKIISSYFTIHELNLHLTEKHLSYVIKNPTDFFNHNPLPKKIKLDCLSNDFVKIIRNLDPYKPMDRFILDTQNLQNFIQMTKNRTHFCLTSMPADINFCKNYVQIFQNISDANQLCKKVEIYNTPTNLAVALNFLNNLLGADKIVEHKENGTKVVYRIQRSDGWVLECISISNYRLCYVVECV